MVASSLKLTMELVDLKYKILIQRYKNKMFGYALFMLKNRMDAEDVTQEAMIRLWKNINSFKVRAASAYIMRMTHNLCIDQIRKNSVSKKQLISLDESFLELPDQDESNSPEKATHQKFVGKEIEFCIRQLPENHRAPFLLYQLQGFKYKEISTILGMSLSAVKINIMRARKKLQDDMRQYEKH